MIGPIWHHHATFSRRREFWLFFCEYTFLAKSFYLRLPRTSERVVNLVFFPVRGGINDKVNFLIKTCDEKGNIKGKWFRSNVVFKLQATRL